MPHRRLALGAGLLLALASTIPLVLDSHAAKSQAPGRVFVGTDAPPPSQDTAQIARPAPRAPEPPSDPLVVVEDAAAQPGLPLTDALRDELGDGDWAAALPLLAAMDEDALEAEALSDRAFLRGWALVHQGDAEDGEDLLEAMAAGGAAPAPYRDMVMGEILLAAERPVEAVEALERVGPDSAAIWPRARVQLAEAYYELERTADSRDAYTVLLERDDPSDGSALALLTAAQRLGLGSDEAYPLLRRIWREYPKTTPDAAARKALSAYEARGSSYRATLDDKAARADALMVRYRYRDAVALIEPLLGSIDEASPAACKAWYAYGRSKYRAGSVTRAHEILAPAGEACPEHDQDRGAKALYLAGKALERKKDWAGAAAVYERIPALYPEHSMADDGYTLAGIGYQESDQPALALERWATQVEAYPDGDMAGEAFWRLAWASYLTGDTATAIRWADQASEVLDIAAAPVHVRAARYWRWRWRLYPDRDDPMTLVDNPAQREQAIEGLLELCRQHPASYYGLLAAGRLQELAPERLAALPHPELGVDPGPWQVRQSFLEGSAGSNAMALARVGLVSEAVTELNQLVEAEMVPGEIGLFTDLLVASGGWIWAHDRLRTYLKSHPPETLESDRARLLTSAYMRRYEDDVKAACADYPWDYRIFHALVREESNFNKDIVSHAGARGLSQLMPATARSVAGWLGISITDSKMFVPSTNLRIGGRYLHYLMEKYGGDPFVALASYNAGEGNVNKWLRERGNRPIDEFVEGIPFRETRHYVKRVSASWQMYHLLYDGGEPFPTLLVYNHQAVPDWK